MRRTSMICVAMGLAFVAGTAGAVTVDGVLDPDYGAALSTQTTQTSLGDYPEDNLFYGELDEAFGYVEGTTLHLLFTGNFNRWYSEFIVYPVYLEVFIDVGPGGQNALSGANPSVGQSVNLQSLAGLTFDDEFAPDYWFGGGRETGQPATELWAYYAQLPSGGGGAGYFLGHAASGGPGTLSGSGSSNPYGVLASIDLSNVAGVTEGCAASSGAGVSTGIEWAIPLAAIGNPAGPIRICALLARPFGGTEISNQVLGPVPPGTCALGAPSSVDFGNIPGLQYFAIDKATPAKQATWGRLKAAYR